MSRQLSDEAEQTGTPAGQRRWEIGVTILCVLYALGAFGLAWGQLSSQQPLWLLPGLYLLEMLGLPAMVMMLVFSAHPIRARFTALSTGAVFAFALLGMFSIGMVYLTLAFGLGVVALLCRRNSAEQAWQVAGWLFLGVLGQGSLMLLLIQLF